MGNHWTDSRIDYDDGQWIAYDDVGVELGRYLSRNLARDALVVYNAIELNGGEVVVTWNEARTEIVAVTRQDSEGRILSVIAEAP